MSLPEKLLNKLVCPQCKGPLHYGDDKTKLICDTCKLGFSIVDNVPVLLVDEAEQL